jgi:hypothetical protein
MFVFNEGQLEYLSRHFLSVSISPSSDQIKKLTQLLKSEGSVNSKDVPLWFTVTRARFQLDPEILKIQSPPSSQVDDSDFDPAALMDRSYFDVLVDGEIIRNCQFLKSQITILVRHFVTVSMCPSEDDISYLYNLIGNRGNGGEEVSRGMVVWWFQEMRQIFKRDKRIDLASEKGWLVGLYTVVLGTHSSILRECSELILFPYFSGFESDWLKVILESDFSQSNYGSDDPWA